MIGPVLRTIQRRTAPRAVSRVGQSHVIDRSVGTLWFASRGGLGLNRMPDHVRIFWDGRMLTPFFVALSGTPDRGKPRGTHKRQRGNRKTKTRAFGRLVCNYCEGSPCRVSPLSRLAIHKALPLPQSQSYAAIRRSQKPFDISGAGSFLAAAQDLPARSIRLRSTVSSGTFPFREPASPPANSIQPSLKPSSI